MRGAQFAYDPAEKPPPAQAAAGRAPLYHADSQRMASAPPLASEPPFALQYAQQPQYQYQAQQYQQQQSCDSESNLPGNYEHSSLRHQSSQQQSHPYAQQQGSFQYYPPPQQQQPLLPQQFTNNQGYPANAFVFHPAIRTKLPRRLLLTQMLKLVGFHTLNAILGFAAFSLLSAGVSTSITLLPICCLGIVMFRITLFGVHVLAQFDVMLVNFVALPSEQVLLEKPLEPGATGVVLAPSLEAFSPVSLLTLLYFLSIKVAIAILSCASAVMTVLPLLVLVTSVCSSDARLNIQLGSTRYSYQSDRAVFVVSVICLTVIGAASMILAAKVSTKVTTFFCCEPFANHASGGGYQQQACQPSHEFAVRSYVSYGSSA